jgi:UDP-perosamine 4-acetyltransferase
VRILVVGGGGHSKVVIDAARCAGHEVVAVLDDRTDISDVLGVPIVSDAGHIEADGFVVALGDNSTRAGRFNELVSEGMTAVSVIHPSAVISETAKIGDGTVVFAGVIVNADTRIGDNVVLNTACTVDHDCRIGAHTHIAPGVHLCGKVIVGEGALVGVGSNAAPGARIGGWSVVGAGATVLGEIADGVVCVGTPARPLPQAPIGDAE